MTGQDYITELLELSQAMDEHVKDLRSGGIRFAEARRVYQVELAKKTTALRLDCFPVTIIGDLSKGDEHIAGLRRDKDVALTLHEQSKEALYVCKLKYRMLADAYNREIGGGR